MSAEALFLWVAALLLALGVAGGVFARERFAHPLVYGGALAMSAAMLVLALVELIRGEAGGALVLPLGIPWIGAHFRIDALSALFLVIVNLGGAAASLYGLGGARSEPSPERVLPFFPAFPRRNEPRPAGR
jgi:hydrogenase-4 component B